MEVTLRVVCSILEYYMHCMRKWKMNRLLQKNGKLMDGVFNSSQLARVADARELPHRYHDPRERRGSPPAPPLPQR